MTYTSGSLTSANPAADLYTPMASALTTAGFTLVDTVVISTRTHKVWKSAAANNAQGLDWYLDVAYTTTGAGSIWLGAFEFYDPATHLAYRGGYNPNDTSASEGTYYSRYGASGFALETNWTYITCNVAQINTQTSNFAYWMSVTTDRVMVMTSVTPTSVMYCGFFDMYAPWANKIGALAYPLVTCTVNAPSNATFTSTAVSNGGHCSALSLANPPPSSNAPMALTRFPPVVKPAGQINWRNQAGVAGVSAAGSSGANTGSGYASAVGLVDASTPSAFFDVARGERLQIAATFNNSSSTDGSTVCLGLLKDLDIFAGNAVTRGDTIVISSTNWVMSSLSSGRCYGFKAI